MSNKIYKISGEEPWMTLILLINWFLQQTRTSLGQSKMLQNNETNK